MNIINASSSPVDALNRYQQPRENNAASKRLRFDVEDTVEVSSLRAGDGDGGGNGPITYLPDLDPPPLGDD